MVIIELDKLKHFFRLILFLNCSFIFSQEPTNAKPCTGELLWIDNHVKEYNGLNYQECIKKLVQLNNPQALKYLNFDPSGLHKVKQIVNSPNASIFIHKTRKFKSIQIQLCFSQHGMIFSSNDSILFDFGIVPESALSDSLGYAIIGNLPYDSRITYELLDSIVLVVGDKLINVNLEKLNGKLININRIYLTNSQKPIEIYYNPKEKNYYVYLYFLNWVFCNNFMPNQVIPVDGISNVLKLIIDPNTGLIGHIIVPPKILFYYGWNDCPNFWPF